MRYRADCITKRGSHWNPHERIQALGGQSPTRWYDNEDNIIAAIERRTSTYYTMVNNREAEIIVATQNGRKYLKTVSDGYAPNNLLNLAECGR